MVIVMGAGDPNNPAQRPEETLLQTALYLIRGLPDLARALLWGSVVGLLVSYAVLQTLFVGPLRTFGFWVVLPLL